MVIAIIDCQVETSFPLPLFRYADTVASKTKFFKFFSNFHRKKRTKLKSKQKFKHNFSHYHIFPYSVFVFLLLFLLM